IIESGWIRTFYTAASGKEITVGLWSTGDLIGAPDYSFQNRLLAAEATKDSTVLILENADIDEFIRTIPSFAKCLIGALSFKVRWATSIFDRLATESLISRVAQTVLSLAHLHGKDGFGGTIVISEISHQDIANMIGAARPSVSLALRQLEASKHIKIGRKRLIVLNVEGLTEYSKH
ncbi:Crp/Fnr family transcriptional regulator, partial [Marinobacter sp. CH_CUG1437-1]